MNFLDNPRFRAHVNAEGELYQEILDNFSQEEVIEQAAREYEDFFKHPRAGQVTKNVAYMWRIHMLAPRCYQKDCRRVFGELVVPVYNDNELVPQLDKDYVRVTSGEGESEARFPSMDLAAGMRRQFNFMGKMNVTLGAAFVDRSVERFQMWARLIGTTKNKLVPTLDIDLVWHSLMLCPDKYFEWSKKEIGYLLNHDDKADRGLLDKQSLSTQELWNSVYPDHPFKAVDTRETKPGICNNDCHEFCSVCLEDTRETKPGICNTDCHEFCVSDCLEGEEKDRLETHKKKELLGPSACTFWCAADCLEGGEDDRLKTSYLS